jgi:hypothetical protein
MSITYGRLRQRERAAGVDGGNNKGVKRCIITPLNLKTFFQQYLSAHIKFRSLLSNLASSSLKHHLNPRLNDADIALNWLVITS